MVFYPTYSIFYKREMSLSFRKDISCIFFGDAVRE